MKQLSVKEKEILIFIQESLKYKQYPPTIREICFATGLKSSSTGHYYLNKLEKKGYIRRDPEISRAIELVFPIETSKRECVSATTAIPLVGQVAAGIPVLATENIEGYYPLPADFFPESEGCFLLKVRGDSMSGAGINENDLIVVRQQLNADNGDIVVALLDEEATVKRLFYQKDCIRLQPENDNYQPIVCQEVSIVGKVVGLFRKM